MVACCVKQCGARKNKNQPNITHHKFPSNDALKKKWIELIGSENINSKVKNLFLCSLHFHETCFNKTLNVMRLRDGALPSSSLLPAQTSFTPFPKDSPEDEPAIFKVCRLCLAMDTKMYDINEHKLDVAYEQVLGVNLLDEEKLPQKICWECAHRLTTANNFKVKALRCQTLLLQILDRTKSIKLKDIKSINRTQNHLNSTLVLKHFENNAYNFYVDDARVVVKQEAGGVGESENFVEVTIEREDDAEEDTSKTVREELESNEKKDATSNAIYIEVDNVGDSNNISKEIADVPKKKVPRKRKVIKEKKIIDKNGVEKSKVHIAPISPVDKYKVLSMRSRRITVDQSLFTVTQLTYEQQVEEVSRRKQEASYNLASFRCDVCYRGFDRQDQYDTHKVRHSELKGTHECFICHTRSKTARALRKHLTAQHTLQYNCKKCEFSTRNRSVAKYHENYHAGVKYQCPHCPIEFDKVTSYLGHLRMKHVCDFVCELCGFTFLNQKGIELHKQRKHMGVDNPVLEGPYCEICDVRFISEEAHERHLRLSSKHSSDDDPNRIRNDSRNVSSLQILTRPRRSSVMRRRKPGEPRVKSVEPVECEQCGIKLRSRRMYMQHFSYAHPGKVRRKPSPASTPYMCEHCGKMFKSKDLLSYHMWIHTGEKRFKCDKCPKSFTQMSSLKVHMRSHLNKSVRYECPICGKHFTGYNNRHRHMFIHTGLKPYKCDTCSKGFTTVGELRAHVKHVHLKEPWPKRVRRKVASVRGNGE